MFNRETAMSDRVQVSDETPKWSRFIILGVRFVFLCWLIPFCILLHFRADIAFVLLTFGAPVAPLYLWFESRSLVNILRRKWVRLHEDGFEYLTRLRRIRYSHDDIVGIGDDVAEWAFTNNTWLSRDMWFFRMADGRVIRFSLLPTWKTKDHVPQREVILRLQNAFQKNVERLLDSGQAVEGLNWSLTRDVLTCGKGGRRHEIPREQFAHVEKIDDFLCVWDTTHCEPIIEVPTRSQNVSVLFDILSETWTQSPPRDTAYCAPNGLSWGRRLYVSRPSIFLRFIARRYVFYERGVISRGFFGTRSLAYEQLDSYSFGTMNGYNALSGFISGRVILVLNPQKGMGRPVSQTVHFRRFQGQVADHFEAVRRNLDECLVAKMREKFAVDRRVTWTAGVELTDREIVLTVRKQLKKTTHRIPYRELVTQWDEVAHPKNNLNVVVESSLVFYASGVPVKTVLVGEKNFYPGKILLGELLAIPWD